MRKSWLNALVIFVTVTGTGLILAGQALAAPGYGPSAPGHPMTQPATQPAQDSASPSAAAAKEPAQSQPGEWLDAVQSTPKPKTRQAPGGDIPWMIEWVDYSGDLADRPALTGDWGGVRQTLMDHGIRFTVSLTQTLQGNIGGGVSKRAWYQGGLRYDIDMDTGHMGLWPGGLIHLRGETQYGKNDNLDSGAMMPVNTDALYPVPGRDITCLSEAYYMQFFSPQVGVMAGKISPRSSNVFLSDETSQFMNAAFNYNMALATTVPLDFLGVGVILKPVDWLTVTTMVFDAEGGANVSGFDTVFESGTSLYQQAEVAIKPFGQQGHQRLSWTWSDKSRVQFEQNGRILMRDIILHKLGLGARPVLQESSDDWSIMYDFDQYFYTKPGTKDQGMGVFGQFGVTNGVVNPVQDFYTIGVGGKGMVPSRDNDTFGVGYYYVHITDKLGPVLSRYLCDEQGVELYYNIAITPWLHLTPDLQIINPGRSQQDQAVVAGLRMKIDF